MEILIPVETASIVLIKQSLQQLLQWNRSFIVLSIAAFLVVTKQDVFYLTDSITISCVGAAN